MSEDLLVSLEQAASILDLSLAALKQAIHAGKLPLHQGQVRASSIRQYLLLVSQLENTRQCQLNYQDKRSPREILSDTPKGQIRWLGEAHSSPYNFFLKGDNYPILHALLPQIAGKVDLVYIDPPFATGRAFVDVEAQVAYEDREVDAEYLETLRVRLLLLRECLSPQGSIFVHIDKKMGHYLKLILDEVFGHENFINDLTRIKCNPKNFARKAFGNYSDMLLYYAKERDQQIFHDIREPLTPEEVARLFPRQDPEYGPYTTHPLHAPGTTQKGDTGQTWQGLHPPPGRHWRYSRAVLDQLQAQGLIEWSGTGNPRKKVFAKDHKGKKIQDVWTFKDKGLSWVEYPTEKNQDLLRRIIGVATHPGSLVLDAFAGSGGTLMVAEEMGRQWIGMDQSEQAWEVASKRLQGKGRLGIWESK